MFVSARFPIEDLDDCIFFTGDEKIAGGFVNCDPFAAVQVSVPIRSGLIELPGRIPFSIGGEAVNFVAMRVYGVCTTARIDCDPPEFREALLTKPRAFELVIVRA